jgi:hypothetical protein
MRLKADVGHALPEEGVLMLSFHVSKILGTVQGAVCAIRYFGLRSW